MATILIAEDEARIADFIAKGLRKAGHEISIATDGNSALEMSLSGDFDVMLLDIGLPGRDGWSVLSELRASSQLPVIVVTAFDGPEERNQSMALGANDFIPKPFRFQNLLSSIRRCL